MTGEIRALIEQRNSIWKRMEELIAEGTTTGEGLVGQRMSDYKTAEADLELKSQDIEARQRHATHAAALALPVEPVIAAPTAPAASENRDADFGDAFGIWLKRGVSGLSPEHRSIMQANSATVELRDQGVGTGGAGGFLVPQGFLTKLTEVLKYYGPMRSIANVIQTASGNDMPWPNNDDTANVGSILGENVAVTNLDEVLTSKTLKSWMYTSGQVKASWQLSNDSAFDLESFLSRKLGQRIGRAQNTHFTTGNGTTQPEGYLTNAATNGAPISQPANGTSNVTAVTYSALVALMHQLNYAYRVQNGVAWQMNDVTLGAVRQIVDTQGRPLWVPAGSFGTIADGEPDRLMGYPINVSSDTPNMAASVIGAISFGLWSQHYIIRDVLGVSMVRLDERYADQLQTGYFAYCRTDGRVDDVKAVAHLKNSAS